MNLIHIAPTKADIALGRKRQKATLAALPLQGNRKVLNQMRDDYRDGKGGLRVSGESVRTRLEGLIGRAQSVCNPVNFIAAKAFLTEAIAKLDQEEHGATLAETVAATMGEGQDARAAKAALGKMIAENVGHLIRYTGQWSQWYKSVTLGETDTPFLREYVPQQVNVRVGNGDGYLSTQDLMPDTEDDRAIPLFFILSEMVRVQLFDAYKGRIADSALAVVDIAMDLKDKIDELLQLPFLVGTPNSVYTASFVNDGTAASHFHASSRINTANYPAGNIITLAANGAATKPRLEAIRAIDQYFSQFGSGFDVSGDMVAGQVHVASGIAHQFADEFDATSHQNAYTDELYKNRGVITWNGRKYEIVPDPTIDPTDKYIYVNSNLPAGIFFDKPAGSLVERKEDTILNEVQSFERALIGYAFPVTHAPRVLAVKFKN